MKVIRNCLFRGLRVFLLLLLIAMASVAVLCLVSPNIKVFEHTFESWVMKKIQAEKFDVSTFKLAWHTGPVLELGKLSLALPGFVVRDARTSISFPIFQLFQGDYAPELRLAGGQLLLDFDVQSESDIEPPNLWFSLQGVDVFWTIDQATMTLQQSNISIAPYFSQLSLNNKVIDAAFDFNEAMQLERANIAVNGLSAWLPESWRTFLSGAQQFQFSVSHPSPDTWAWQLDVVANEEGMISIPSAHVNVPFGLIQVEGEVSLESGQAWRLKDLNISSLRWRNHDDFADAKLNWRGDNLYIQVLDGATSMPMLWSWLWLLGEEDFQQWLSLMKHGRLEDIRAILNVPWKNPLTTAPTPKNLDAMTYHVRTHVLDADIALGLEGDFLWHTDADVELDQDGLTAHMNQTDLDRDSGRITGDFAMDWDTLMMRITGQGSVDVGKLHAWLDQEAAHDLHWGKAAATARLDMRWDVDADDPEKAVVYLKPKTSWTLRPHDIPLVVHQGVAIWDANKGLTLKNMQAHSPWLDGKVSMFFNSKHDWNVEGLSLDGHAPLAQLTRQFSLPIEQPQGQTDIQVQLKDGVWQGSLDFTSNDWVQFLGFDKDKGEAFRLHFTGKSGAMSLFPLHLEQVQSDHPDFQLAGRIKIDEKTLDFQLKDIQTPAFSGDFRMNIPLDDRVAWGMEVSATHVDEPAFSMYFATDEARPEQQVRPWHVYADIEKLTWKKSYAEGVHIQFASDKKSIGSLRAAHLVSSDVDLTQVEASFSMLEQGKIDLHLLEAEGAGQHMKISGSVLPLASGALQWRGLVILNGEFGTLMHQAELDKLFQHGEMSAVFLGHGEYMHGEPWFRRMQGRFRLLVKDGRMMQGGTLTRLLAALSLVDLPKFLILQRDDMQGRGLLYEKMQIEATFDEDKLFMDKLAFRSSALDAGGQGMFNLDSGDLDVLLIARPWQNMESLLSHIPLLGYLLTGEDKSLLRKVYRIHGPASDAVVDEIDPEDAGLPRSGLLEHLFSLPSQWFGD